ncbi:hypothetical protein K438DRAFT_18343 [Mycena galopus ATCC 62051]|nr:hypothetical protein K438DRAFT_18343 [Mycena galopus ATCC 62051]
MFLASPLTRIEVSSPASTALQAMHGVEIEWKLMSVTYHLLNMRGRPAHGKPASEKTHTSEAPLETPPLATWRDRAKNARMPQAESMTKKAGVVDAQTDRDSFEKPHTPGPQIKTETAERGMPTLQVLYDTEKACRIATQAENERLRAELVSMKQQGNAENKLLREELESVKQLDAENELLREELESVKQLDAENELLLEELESAKLQGEAEIELLKEKLESTRRALEMAESRLKILQLEADRPLWEAAKKKREENQRAERAKEEERRRAAEVEESRRKMREFQEQEKARKSAAEKERMRRQAEEKARREKEEQEREQRETAQRERERLWKAATEAEEARCEKRDEQMFGAGAWTPLRALERLKLQVAEFEKIKFSEGQPLTFRVIPWPVLTDPLDSDIEQIEWNAVEAFFTRAKIQLATNAEYNGLVEKVHRLFHPDKWKSRNLLVTVLDEELRKSLETAGNVVAQAMTPIWRKSRGYLDH